MRHILSCFDSKNFSHYPGQEVICLQQPQLESHLDQCLDLEPLMRWKMSVRSHIKHNLCRASFLEQPDHNLARRGLMLGALQTKRSVKKLKKSKIL